jgi:O-succinylbenzoate synthase
MHDVCARAGIPVWGGTMPELGIGAAQTIHLATLPNFTFPTDVESSRRWFVDDIIDPLVEVHSGRIVLPAGAGYGYRLNEKMIGKYTVRKEVFPWR